MPRGRKLTEEERLERMTQPKPLKHPEVYKRWRSEHPLYHPVFYILRTPPRAAEPSGEITNSDADFLIAWITLQLEKGPYNLRRLRYDLEMEPVNWKMVSTSYFLEALDTAGFSLDRDMVVTRRAPTPRVSPIALSISHPA